MSLKIHTAALVVLQSLVAQHAWAQRTPSIQEAYQLYLNGRHTQTRSQHPSIDQRVGPQYWSPEELVRDPQFERALTAERLLSLLGPPRTPADWSGDTELASESERGRFEMTAVTSRTQDQIADLKGRSLRITEGIREYQASVAASPLVTRQSPGDRINTMSLLAHAAKNIQAIEGDKFDYERFLKAYRDIIEVGFRTDVADAKDLSDLAKASKHLLEWELDREANRFDGAVPLIDNRISAFKLIAQSPELKKQYLQKFHQLAATQTGTPDVESITPIYRAMRVLGYTRGQVFRPMLERIAQRERDGDLTPIWSTVLKNAKSIGRFSNTPFSTVQESAEFEQRLIPHLVDLNIDGPTRMASTLSDTLKEAVMVSDLEDVLRLEDAFFAGAPKVEPRTINERLNYVQSALRILKNHVEHLLYLPFIEQPRVVLAAERIQKIFELLQTKPGRFSEKTELTAEFVQILPALRQLVDASSEPIKEVIREQIHIRLGAIFPHLTSESQVQDLGALLGIDHRDIFYKEESYGYALRTGYRIDESFTLKWNAAKTPLEKLGAYAEKANQAPLVSPPNHPDYSDIVSLFNQDLNALLYASQDQPERFEELRLKAQEIVIQMTDRLLNSQGATFYQHGEARDSISQAIEIVLMRGSPSLKDLETRTEDLLTKLKEKIEDAYQRSGIDLSYYGLLKMRNLLQSQVMHYVLGQPGSISPQDFESLLRVHLMIEHWLAPDSKRRVNEALGEWTAHSHGRKDWFFNSQVFDRLSTWTTAFSRENNYLSSLSLKMLKSGEPQFVSRDFAKRPLPDLIYFDGVTIQGRPPFMDRGYYTHQLITEPPSQPDANSDLVMARVKPRTFAHEAGRLASSIGKGARALGRSVCKNVMEILGK